MKFLFHKILILTAFSLLLAHNLIPHHHHLTSQSGQTYHHDDSNHDDHHHPFSFFSVDENFVFQSFDLKITIPSAIVAVVPSADDFGEITKEEHPGFISIPSGHPPSPPFLMAFSFRGPPVI